MVMLNIEPSDFCNARCFYCVNGQKPIPHPQRGGFLPLEIHHKIFEDLDSFLCDFSCMPSQDKGVYLRYCGVGEPTLHPDLIEMLKKGLHCPKVKILALLSNGSGWDKKLIDNFIQSIISVPDMLIELVFSLDTLNPQTQFKIKQLKNIDIVIQQLLYTLDLKEKLNLKNTHFIFQMIVLEENISEVEDFLNFWKKQLENRKMSWRVVSDPTYTKYFSQTDCFIWFKCRDSDAMTQEKFRDLQKSAFKQIGLPLNQKNDNPVPLHPQARFKDICSILWYGVNIAAKADVSPCCVDVDFDLKIGNLKINSLKEIYLGEEMKKLRLAHIGNNLQDYSVCRNCSFSHFAGPVCDNDIAAYIEGINS